ncbi:MAG: hypothetical protein PHI99_00325 [Syntrophales bacterium]|nr:hypothetical protein [Syntrophales bacterium]
MRRHEPFWQITQDSLDYALDAFGIADRKLRNDLIKTYLKLGGSACRLDQPRQPAPRTPAGATGRGDQISDRPAGPAGFLADPLASVEKKTA